MKPDGRISAGEPAAICRPQASQPLDCPRATRPPPPPPIHHVRHLAG